MVHRCSLAKVEEDMAWLACAWDLCEIWCLCEFGYPSRGRPSWLYICSQLGFTSNVCLLLQVKVLGLAGFGYPSSGLLPWQEPGRQISRTEGSYPRQTDWTVALHRLHCIIILPLVFQKTDPPTATFLVGPHVLNSALLPFSDCASFPFKYLS
jgi:hypothetical protein